MKSLLLACILVGMVATARPASATTLQEANKAYEDDRYDDIVRLFTDLLAQGPSKDQTIDFLDKRAYGLRKLKRHPEAVGDYRRLMDLGGMTPPRLNHFSVSLYTLGEWEESYAMGMRAYVEGREQGLPEDRLTIYQDNFTSTSWEIAAKFPAFVEATEHAKRGNHERVLELVSTVLSEHPTGPHELACRTERAKASLEVGRAALALRDWQRVRELGGDTPAMLEQLGGCYLILHNNRQAYETFRLVLIRDAIPADRARHRVNLAMAAKRLDEDVARLQRDADAALQRADLPAAFAAYELAMSFPGTRSDSFSWGLLQFSRQVSESYLKLLKGAEERLRQKAWEGDVAGIQEEYRTLQALAPAADEYVDKLRDEAFDRMLQAGPQRPALELLYKVNKLEKQPQNAKRAIKLLSEAIAKVPNVPPLYVQRASWLTLLKDARALTDLEEATRLLGSESVATLVARGLYHEAVGDRPSALALFRRAAVIRSDFHGPLSFGLREAFQEDLLASPLVQPVRERVAGPHGLPLDPKEAGRFIAAAHRSATNTDPEPEPFEARRRHSLAEYSWAITLYPLASGAYYGRGERLRGDYNQEALRDFVIAQNLGNSRAAAEVQALRNQLPSTAYIPRVRPPEPGGGAAAGSVNRYCMRCRATGTVYAYEDDVDAHNNRVRVERKITCPECGGRGVR